jgi:hypothetical protein
MSIGLRMISEMKRIASEQRVTLPPLGDFIKAYQNAPA